MGATCPSLIRNAARGGRAGGKEAEEEVDAQLTAAVIAWVVQQFAKGEGAVLCFLPVGGLGGWREGGALSCRIFAFFAIYLPFCCCLVGFYFWVFLWVFF